MATLLERAEGPHSPNTGSADDFDELRTDEDQQPDGFAERFESGTLTDEDRTWLAHRDLRDELRKSLRRAEKQRNLALKVLEGSEKTVNRYREDLGLMPIAGGDADIEPTEALLEAFSEGTLTLKEFAALDLPPIKWLWGESVPSGALGAILAAEKTGKSLLAFDLGAAIAQGEPFMERPTSQCNVLVLEQEGSREAWQARISKMFGGSVPDGFYFRHRMVTNLQDLDQLAGLQAFITEHNTGIVLIGPLAQTGDLEDENKSTEINRICKNLNRVVTATGATIALIHHRKKPIQGQSYNSLSAFFNTSRGSNALIAAVDFAIGLQREPENPLGKMFVLLRDGPGRIDNYRLDFTNLRISLTDEVAIRKADKTDMAVLAWMLDNPGQYTRREIEVGTGLNLSTIRDATTRLFDAGRLEKSTEGRALKYEVDAKYREDMAASPRDQNGLTGYTLADE